MPFEVVGFLFQCSDIHSVHSNLQDAAVCFTKRTRRFGGSIPIHPVSQKYIYTIVARDRKGNRRNFSKPERAAVTRLRLDPKSVEQDVPGITTFYRVASLYYEALRLVPISGINLDGLLDRSNKANHFWTTDAGIGQALAYAQQAAFTVELSLKAYLEGLGKLASSNPDDIRSWKRHGLIKLLRLLEPDEEQHLEELWRRSSARHRLSRNGFHDLLMSINRHYERWRYITDLKDRNLSMDVAIMLGVSEFLLSASGAHFRENSPFKMTTTITSTPSESDEDNQRLIPTVIEGRVQRLEVPEGFNPYSKVVVLIDTEDRNVPIVAHFYRRDVQSYHGIEGTTVRLYGEIGEHEPNLLRFPRVVDPLDRESLHKSENRTLFGSVYDMRLGHGVLGSTRKIHLDLFDKTYFTHVECLFVTDQERSLLEGVHLGDTVLIHGMVASLCGMPMILVGPDRIEKTDEPDAKTD